MIYIPRLRRLKKRDFEANKCFCRPKKSIKGHEEKVRLNFTLLDDAITSEELLKK
jgi:hypothetical protein